MKKTPLTLIIKLLLIGIPVYILMLYTYLFPMNYMPIEYSMWQQEMDYTRSGDSADILILGDSRAKSGLIPAEITTDKSIYNMAIGGCTPIEMYYAMNRYLKYHSAPDEIILIFAPYHFCEIDNWGQTQMYNYLSSTELSEVFINSVLYNDVLINKDSYLTDNISYKLRLPNKYMDSIYNARLNGRFNDNTAKYNSVAADLGYTEFGTADGDDNPNYETHHPFFDDSDMLGFYFKRILKLCDDNNIHVTFIQSPVNETSYNLISKDFLEGYEYLLNEAFAPYPDFTYETEIPMYSNDYFGDANHLNKTGAMKFTKEVNDRYFN